MMIKKLSSSLLNFDFFFQDFQKRFISLLNLDFNKIDLQISLDLIDANLSSKSLVQGEFSPTDLSLYFSAFDL